MFSKKGKLKSPNLRRKKKNRQIVGWVSLVIIVASAGTDLYFFSRLPDFSIDSVVVSGESVDAEEIKTLATGELNQTWFGLVKRNSAFFVPGKTIAAAIMSRYPSLKEAVVSLNGLHELKISVVKRESRALWCKGTEDDFRNNLSPDCFFIDETGYIFNKAANFSGVYVKYFGLVEKVDPLFSFYSPPVSFSDLDQFLNRLNETGFSPARVYTNEDVIKIRLKANGELILSPELSLKNSFANLQAVLKDKGYKAGDFETLPKFEYIDLRHTNKVWLKPL